MKSLKMAGLLAGALVSFVPASRAGGEDLPLPRNFEAQRAFYNQLGMSFSDLASLLSSELILLNNGLSSAGNYVPAYTPPPESVPTLSNFEVKLPHKTQKMITVFEKRVLTAYLDHPTDVRLAKLLALYHLLQTVSRPQKSPGAVLEHQVLADYFLSRSKDLGAREKWIELAASRVEKDLANLGSRFAGVAQEETHSAHQAFNDAMFYHEENRYIAADKLLDDYVAGPNNVYTSFLLGATNLWTGGEAGFDDPTALYNFVLGSYFSLRARDLAQQAEQAWQQDPVHHARFRLASIIGGFTVSHRRFLAKLSNDATAVSSLDAEHLQWFAINPPFHMFTVGYTLFEEPTNFNTAFDRWLQGLDFSSRPDLITPLNRPRYTFNQICIFVGSMDFFLKIGDVATARNLWAATVPYLPNYAEWSIGRDGYEHRLAHAEEISALYLDSDPKNDPVPFNVKKRKWGMDTQTCQTCHQTQQKIWSEEEKKNVLIAPDDILTVGDWPTVTTTWYGRSK